MHKAGLVVAGISGLAFLILGSFGSHGIEFPEGGRAMWAVAERQHAVHTLALLIVAATLTRRSRFFTVAGYGFVLGMLLFCTTVYARATGADGGWASLAPIGGTILMLAWICLAIGGMRAREG